MGKLLFILAVSLGSLFVGYALRRLGLFGSALAVRRTEVLSKNIKLVSVFVLNPIPILDSFWRLSFDFRGIVFFPLLGLFSLAVGAAGAVLVNRLFRIPPSRAASVFVCGMFTNIVSFGGLTAYVFFGYQGYGLVQLFNMFISFSYYAIGFPVSERLARGVARPFVVSPKPLIERPYLFVPLGAIAAGLLLNLFGVTPVFLVDRISSVLIPAIAGLLGFSIGLTLYFGRIREYRKEIGLVALIKFLLVPLVMLPIGLLLGLPAMMGGLPFKVLAIVSFMPVAFNSLVPPALYGFDLDLANSAWIVTTVALVIVLPALYFALAA